MGNEFCEEILDTYGNPICLDDENVSDEDLFIDVAWIKLSYSKIFNYFYIHCCIIDAINM